MQLCTVGLECHASTAADLCFPSHAQHCNWVIASWRLRLAACLPCAPETSGTLYSCQPRRLRRPAEPDCSTAPARQRHARWSTPGVPSSCKALLMRCSCAWHALQSRASGACNGPENYRRQAVLSPGQAVSSNFGRWLGIYQGVLRKRRNVAALLCGGHQKS